MAGIDTGRVAPRMADTPPHSRTPVPAPTRSIATMPRPASSRIGAGFVVVIVASGLDRTDDGSLLRLLGLHLALESASRWSS